MLVPVFSGTNTLWLKYHTSCYVVLVPEHDGTSAVLVECQTRHVVRVPVLIGWYYLSGLNVGHAIMWY